jgi:hypothetical protein
MPNPDSSRLAGLRGRGQLGSASCTSILSQAPAISSRSTMKAGKA